MTDDNFYKKEGSLGLENIIPSILQYSGIMAGLGSVFEYILKKSPTKPDKVELLYLSACGLLCYVVGKVVEYKQRSDTLSASFTHLEETLREEMRRK